MIPVKVYDCTTQDEYIDCLEDNMKLWRESPSKFNNNYILEFMIYCIEEAIYIGNSKDKPKFKEEHIEQYCNCSCCNDR